MTLKEAKKILEKEGFYVEKATRPCAISESFIEYEDPTICEAMQVVGSAGYFVGMEMSCFNERKARLKKELEEHANAPVSGKEQPKEKKGIIYPSTSPKADFYYKHVLNEGNPALEESASQFNDALLDEQGKKIKRLGKEIARLNKTIRKKNLKIEEFRKESSRHLRGKIKIFGENMDLSQELCDKNEELRLTKIREKNLAELGLKYVGENEKLKKKLADKIVDEIDARALKSAESALAYKEKVIAEKDEVIADLGKELAEAKKLNTAKILDFNAKCMRAARESINDVFESYAAKYAKSTLDELKDKAYESFNAKAHKLGFVGSKDGNGIIDQMEEDSHPTEDNPEEVELDEILECVRKALEDGHTVSIDYDKAEEGGDQSATIVQCDNGIILSKEEAEIIERCTKNGTELHYSEKDGFTYTNVFGEEMPIRCLRGMFHVFTDEEIENMKK